MDLENRFITVGSGRLTLRRGELLHFNRDWVDPEAKTIEIPAHEPCECSYCQDRAEDYADDNDITYEEALELTWSPKTAASARTIYYGWSPQTIAAVEDFAEVVGSLDMNAATINRRVTGLGELSGIGGDNIYPHALRAAAGLFWADLGLEAHYLQAIMGWNSIDVAVAYLRVSGRQLAQRIEHAFSVGGLDRPDPIPDEDLCPPSNEATKQAAETDGVTTHPEVTSLSDYVDSAA